MSVYHSDPGGDVAKKKKASKQDVGNTLGGIAESLGSLLGNAEKQWRAWEGPRTAVVKAVTDVRDRAAALLSEMGAAAEAAAGKGSKKGKKKDKKEKKGKKAKKAKAEKAAAEKAAMQKRPRPRGPGPNRQPKQPRPPSPPSRPSPPRPRRRPGRRLDAGRWPRGPRPRPLPPPLRPPPPPRPAIRQNSDPARARSSGG